MNLGPSRAGHYTRFYYMSSLPLHAFTRTVIAQPNIDSLQTDFIIHVQARFRSATSQHPRILCTPYEESTVETAGSEGDVNRRAQRDPMPFIIQVPSFPLPVLE